MVALSGGTPDRKDSREYMMRVAIDKADGLTLADRWVFSHLLTIADFATAKLPDRFQPRSLKVLAADCHMSVSQVKYSVGHLQRHGWLLRHRNLTDKGIGGRNHPTRYELEIGHECDCKSGQPVASSRKKGASEWPRKGPQEVPVSAGQAKVPAGRARGRESKEGEPEPDYPGGPVDWETGEPLASITAPGWDEGSWGAAENRES